MAFTGSELGDATSERLVRLNSEAYERQQQRLQQGQSSPIEDWYGAELARRAQQKLQESPPEQAAYRADVTQSNAWQDALNDANAQLVFQQRTSLLDRHAAGGNLMIDPARDEATPTLGSDVPTGPRLPRPFRDDRQPPEFDAGPPASKIPVRGPDRPPPNFDAGDSGVPPTKDLTIFDPAVQEYRKELRKFYEHRYVTPTPAGGTGVDGDFAGSVAQALTPTGNANAGFPGMAHVAFPGFLRKNPKTGSWTYEKAGPMLQAVSANAMKDPKLAGELMFAMSSTGAYPHAAEEAVIDRLYRDPNSGDILGHWTETDLTALHTALLQVSLIQADEIPQSIYRDPLEILRDRTHQSEQLVKNNIPQGPPKAAGRGGGGRGGGGGGGSAPGIQVDPDQLKLLVNNVAKQELGRQLSDEEAQRFVSAFQANAGDMAKVNPQGRATAFMQGDKKLVNEAAGQSSGQFVMALARFLASPAPGALPKGTQANG